MKTCFCFAVAAVGAVASAQYVVVPNQYATTAASGSGLNTFIRDINNTRTGQLLVNANQLGSLQAGDQITGMTFRLWTGATIPFPDQPATWNDYSIWVGQGVAPLAGSTTFASNFLGTPTLVRSGALTIPAGSFSVGGSPNAWGFEIGFQTPFTYAGGHLTFEIRHGGSNIVNPAGSFLEVATQSDAGYAAGNFRSYTSTSNTATIGGLADFTVTRLTVNPVPEPGTMAALGLGALAVVRRRRSNRK
jgi:hypothetical protein